MSISGGIQVQLEVKHLPAIPLRSFSLSKVGKEPSHCALAKDLVSLDWQQIEVHLPYAQLAFGDFLHHLFGQPVYAEPPLKEQTIPLRTLAYPVNTSEEALSFLNLQSALSVQNYKLIFKPHADNPRALTFIMGVPDSHIPIHDDQLVVISVPLRQVNLEPADPEKHALLITSDNGGVLNVNVSPEETIATIKNKIHEKCGVPLAHQTLLFDVKKLDDNEKLRAYPQIKSGTALMFFASKNTNTATPSPFSFTSLRKGEVRTDIFYREIFAVSLEPFRFDPKQTSAEVAKQTLKTVANERAALINKEPSSAACP